MIAKARNLLARELGDLQHGHAVFELDIDAIDLGYRHGRLPLE